MENSVVSVLEPTEEDRKIILLSRKSRSGNHPGFRKNFICACVHDLIRNKMPTQPFNAAHYHKNPIFLSCSSLVPMYSTAIFRKLRAGILR